MVSEQGIAMDDGRSTDGRVTLALRDALGA